LIECYAGLRGAHAQGDHGAHAKDDHASASRTLRPQPVFGLIIPVVRFATRAQTSPANGNICGKPGRR